MNKDQAILDAIREFWQVWGYAPTVRDIVQATGISSTSVVAYHLHALKAQGKVVWAENKTRTLRVA